METFLEEKPITIILKDVENNITKNMYCHKTQLAESSEFFKALFFGELSKDLAEYVIETENIPLDAILISAMYSNNYDFNDYPFDEKYTILLRMKYYGFRNINIQLLGLDKNIKPTDCIYLIENYQDLEEINNILIKYVRLFIIDILTIAKDSLNLINKQNKQLTEKIFFELMTRPSFAYSEYDVKNFYQKYGYVCHRVGGRSITTSELKTYSYLPNSKNIYVFKFDTFVMYMIIKHHSNISYDDKQLISQLNLQQLNDNQLFFICKDITDIKTKNNIFFGKTLPLREDFRG